MYGKDYIDFLGRMGGRDLHKPWVSYIQTISKYKVCKKCSPNPPPIPKSQTKNIIILK